MSVSLKWITPDAQTMIVDCARVSSDPEAAKHTGKMSYFLDYFGDFATIKRPGRRLHRHNPGLTDNGSYEDHVMAKRPLPSPEVLRQLLRYEPETGRLIWLERGLEYFTDGSYDAARRAARWNSRYAGREAGTDNGKGYLCTRLGGVPVKVHRIIWAIVHGYWPEQEVDHINGNRADNRINNLRCVDRITNMRNASMRRNNKSGVTGVRARGASWEAHIGGGGRQVYLGRFARLEEAGAARDLALKSGGYSPRHGRGS